MKPSIKFKTTRRLQRWSTAGRTAPLFLTLMLVCFAVSPHAHAGCQQGWESKQNTALGEDALVGYDQAAWPFSFCTAVGYHAMDWPDAYPYPGGYDTAVGALALQTDNGNGSNTAVGFSAAANLSGHYTGSDNVAIGFNALSNGFAFSNTAIGAYAMEMATETTFACVAVGYAALQNNSTDHQTAVGGSALSQNTSGDGNTAVGYAALGANQIGNYNTAAGLSALGNNTASNNTADGYQALAANVDGTNNTATGSNALTNNTDGGNNTANGFQALESNTTEWYNTANGASALQNNNGSDNTADGYQALLLNTTGYDNTASGLLALANNTTGNSNTADGVEALLLNTTGSYNTATGEGALYNNTTAIRNTATGYQALVLNTTGHDNTAVGYLALGNNTSGNYNTGIGQTALFNNPTGSSNIALDGGGLLTTGSYNIDIGNLGVAGEANTIRIGTQGGGRLAGQTAAYIAGINGAAVMGVAVKVNSAGQLGTAPSSARFKEEIQPMDKASEVILALKPVSFRYKKKIDPDRMRQFGLAAEEVEKVNPDLVARDDQGKPYMVRYEAVNAMLLNEFLKEHRNVEEQQAMIADLKVTVARQEKRFAEQETQIEALASGLQKVNAQLEVNKPAAQVALDR
jgi:Chaperone of endosialidase